MEDLQITNMENYPIKWVCNYKGQKAIGICGKTKKIAMIFIPNLQFLPRNFEKKNKKMQ